MGLETLLTHVPATRMRFVRDDDLVDPFQVWRDSRNERHASLLWVQVAVASAMFGWMLWALRKTKLLWVGPPLALALVVSVTNISCYYYSMFLIAALLVPVRRELGPVVLVASGASQVLILNFYWMDDKFAAQAWLFCIFAALLLVGYSRLPRHEASSSRTRTERRRFSAVVGDLDRQLVRRELD